MSRRSPDAEVLRDVHDEDENEGIESIDRPAEIARQDRAAPAWPGRGARDARQPLTRRHHPAISGRFTMATNDPHSAGCKRHDGRTSDSGCARGSLQDAAGPGPDRALKTAN